MYMTLNEKKALAGLADYWLKQWDWEYPILFGIDYQAIKNVTDGWPDGQLENEIGLFIALGLLRETLAGASPIEENRLRDFGDIDWPELLTKVSA